MKAALLLLLLLVTPLGANEESPQIATATEALFLAQGAAETYAHAQALLPALPLEVHAHLDEHGSLALYGPVFRDFATLERMRATLFLRWGLRTAYFYFLGRARGYDQMANRLGEP